MELFLTYSSISQNDATNNGFCILLYDACFSCHALVLDYRVPRPSSSVILQLFIACVVFHTIIALIYFYLKSYFRLMRYYKLRLR